MLIFETILGLLLGATLLSVLATRLSVPYPTLLALGGALLAFVPGVPPLELEPELILALFVAPVLLDAAYDASLRDMRDNWRPIMSLVLIAVALTTAAVAFAARQLMPGLPWAAAVALGALVAPPDAVAALAVLRQVEPPHRIRKVLEGESLLNDASALLIYRLAVGAVALGGFSAAEAIPTFAVVVFGSIVVGWLLSWPVSWLISKIDDTPTSVILQFVTTFGVWLLAERLHLSGVVTIVVFGLTMGRRTARPMAARMRLPSFAIWESAVVVLNVLAFTLVGLHVRPILEPLTAAERVRYLTGALVILAVVIGIRIVWVMTYNLLVQAKNRLFGVRLRRGSMEPPTTKSGVVVAWSGMRGIVTLAAAMGLPAGFPYRDFIQLSAFVVVLGTLLVQGLTLKPLIVLLRLPKDETIEHEASVARAAALKAVVQALDGKESSAAERLRREYGEALARAKDGGDPRDTPDNALRRRLVDVSRQAIADLRRSGEIGDDAYRRVEEELDWLELSARPAHAEAGPD